MNIGLMRVIGPLFGIPPLAIEHLECQVEGAPRCVYRVTWARRSRLPRPRRRQSHLEEQVAALTTQVDSLQSMAADLVSSDDLDSVLARIVARAAGAVTATRYLLVVAMDDHDAPKVHHDGFTDLEARAVAARLLEAPIDSADQRSIVIDVASARRHYGRLAAFYDEHDFFPHERKLLAAYARSAAAALDAASALEEARRRGETASALLALAHALADLTAPDEVAARLCEALPSVLGGDRALVALWDPTVAAFAVRARCGWDEDDAEAFTAALAGRPHVPEVARWLSSPEPFLLRTEHRRFGTVLEHLGLGATAVIPVTSHGELLGAAAVAFAESPVPDDVDELRARAAGVGDQAATALQNARLLEQMRHQALHDPVTGLPNRTLFEEHAARATQRSSRSGTELALLFVDLDRFKRINDSLGHEAGDAILHEVARRLEGCVRAGDVVARLGGDEFTLLLDNASLDESREVAARTLERLGEPIEVTGETVFVSASIGVASFPSDGTSYAELLRNADAAMYRAKQRGRNNVQLHGARPAADGRSRLALEGDLRRALGGGDGLWLAYQPEVDLVSGATVGLEALVRWLHPEHGELAPDEFLHVVRESGLDAPLDAWVLRTACRQVREWEHDGVDVPRVAVNVSASQCNRPELLEAVVDALAEFGVEPQQLELEISEDAALDAASEPLEVLQAIQRMQVGLALDDFGVGYSMFGFVRDLPVQKIKVDRSFLDRLDDHDRQSIVGAIVAMGDALGLDVLAEGVETPEQMSVLRRLGCRYGQGFLFGRPVPPAAVPDLLVGPLVEPQPARRR
jgi:diguanylate cyclase (GGDEF)-like protein